MSDILKKYVCLQPFRYMDVQPMGQYVCCPSWCPVDIGQTDDLGKNWKSEKTHQIRESMIDGSYKFCNHKICPSLSALKNNEQIVSSFFITKEEFEQRFNIKNTEDLKNFNGLPEEILFGFDRSCNLKCPSCRINMIPNDDVESLAHQEKLKTLDSIEKSFSPNLKQLMITGSGDPFYSKIYRDYLVNFDKEMYPNLENIHIITNGVLLNEKMWGSLNCKEFIKSIEISVDAGCKETYENVTRLNGDWDKLISNIDFLSRQKSIRIITFSMVISKHNYKEMLKLYDLIEKIFQRSKSVVNFSLHFFQIVHWDWSKYTFQDVKELSVFEKKHPLFQDFLNEIQKIRFKKNVRHNFHHLLNEIEK